MNPKAFEIATLDRTIEGLRRLLEHRRAVPTVKSDELYYATILKYYQDVDNALKEGKPIVGHTGPIPTEILYAMDIVPYLFLLNATINTMFANKAIQETLEASKQIGLSPALCTGHRVMVGAAMLGMMVPTTALLYSSISCDTMAGSGKIIAELLRCPSYFLDVQHEYGNKEITYLTDELKDLIGFLEKTTGHKLDREKLREAVDNTRQVIKVQGEIHELRKAVPTPLRSRNAQGQHVVDMAMMGSIEAVRYVTAMRDEAKERVEQHRGIIDEERYRLVVLFPAPQFAWRLLDWMEKEHGAVVVAEPVCNQLWGNVATEGEDLLETVARDLVNRPMNWPLTGPGGNAVRAVVESARESKADGVLQFSHIPCIDVCPIVRSAKDAVRDELGIPFYNIDCDTADPTVVSEEEIKDKLESFFEILHERKYG